MALAMEKLLVPAIGHPTAPFPLGAERTLEIAVVFTSVESTLAALKEAGVLASSLGAKINLVVPQVVPYPALLVTPPVLIEFNERRFRVMARQSTVETNVHIYLCRDRLETLTSVLKTGTIVVLGGRGRRWPAWFPTKEQRLARQLRRAGFEVIFKETE